MKLKYLILGFLLGVLSCVLIAEWIDTHPTPIHKKNNLRLYVDSFSNVDIIVSDADHEQPCPLEYTNVLSNTNLFTPQERKLIELIPLIYGNITTNSGPQGTMRLSLRKKYTLFAMWPVWIARFQFTNSDMEDEVVFNQYGRPGTHRVRNKAGDGYDVNALRMESGSQYGGSAPAFQLFQYKHGVLDGLYVEIHGDYCMRWMYFSNGLAVDQWLVWSPYGDKLSIWVKFKKPYDYWKYSRTGIAS